MTSLTATGEYHQHRKSDMFHVHSWNKSMGHDVRAVVNRSVNYVTYIATARIYDIKAKTFVTENGKCYHAATEKKQVGK